MGDPISPLPSIASPLPLAGGAERGPVALSAVAAEDTNPAGERAGNSQEGDILRFRDDEAHDEPAVTLDAFLEGQTNATAVRLEAGDDARALLPHLGQLGLVEISFPSFRDGRGYSSARVLREAGYEGELRAQGDVLVDQLPLMRRCGFDSFAPEAPIDPAVLQRSLERYEHHYQPAADAAVPVWKLRHG